MKRIIAVLVVTMLLVTAAVGVYATDTIVDEIAIDAVLEGIEEVEEVDEAELVVDDFDLMAVEMPVYFEQDFSTWTDADLADITAVTKGTGTISLSGDVGYKFIYSLAGGALTLKAAGTNATDAITFNVTEDMGDKNAVIEYKLKKEAAICNAGDIQRNIYIVGTAGSQKLMMMDNNGEFIESEAKHKNGSVYSALKQPTTDADGFYNIKTEFYVTEYNGSDAWMVDMYDALTEEKFYSICYTADKIGTAMKGFRLGGYRSQPARQDASGKLAFTLKNIKISEMAEKPDLYVTDISHKGGQFEPGTKNLKLTFNKGVNQATLADGLSFTKTDNSAIGGGVFYEFESANVLNIKFGRLPIGNYKLSINSNLKNTDGGFAGDAEYVYNVTSTTDSDYLYHDFSSWETADLSETSKGIGTAVMGGAVGYKTILTLEEDGALTLQSKGVNSTDYVDFVTTDYIANQNAIATFKLKSTPVENMVVSVQRNINLCIQGTGSSVNTLRMNNDGSLTSVTSGSIGNDTFSQPKKDDNGYFNIKIDFHYGDFKGAEAWVAEFYDMNSNGQKFYGLYYAPEKFPTGLGGLGYGFYRDSKDRAAGTYVAMTIKDLHVVQGRRRVFALYNDGENAQPDVENVTLIYDDTLSSNTFAEGNVKLLDGTTELPITYEGDTAARKLIVKPVDYLEYGKTYIIKVLASDIVNTSFTTVKRPVSVTNATLADGIATITLDSVAEGEGSVVLGMYDADGKVVGFKTAPVAESVTFEEIPGEVVTIKVYATEKFDGYTRKACETVTYTIIEEA